MQTLTTLLLISLWGYNSLQGCDKHNHILYENNQSKEIKFLHIVHTSPKDEYGDTGCNHIYVIDVLSRASLLSDRKNMMNDFLNDSVLLSSISTSKNYFESNLSRCDAMDSHISVEDESEKIVFVNQDIITTEKLSYFYGAGAVHGQYSTVYSTYSRNTGMKLTWDALFSDKAIEKYVLDRVMHELADKEYLAFTDSHGDISRILSSVGINIKSDVMNFKKIGYFAIVKDGLTIKYNPYEIAPFSEGSPSLVIKKEILKPYMSKVMYKMCFGENLVRFK